MVLENLATKTLLYHAIDINAFSLTLKASRVHYFIIPNDNRENKTFIWLLSKGEIASSLSRVPT